MTPLLDKSWILTCVIVAVICSCKNNAPESRGASLQIHQDIHTTASHKHYNFDEPSLTLSLSPELVEISGLTYDTISGMLMAVNDELGNIYHINKTDGRTVNVEKFGKKGDYEGLATTASTVYIMKSNGQLQVYDRTTTELVKYKTGLTAMHDAEGLLLIDDTTLLIASKGNAKGGKKNSKQVYSYDIASQSMADTPHLHIDDIKLIELSQQPGLSNIELQRARHRAKQFSPSGIAKHPLTGDIYIVSAKGSTIVIVDAAGDIKELIMLNEKQQQQPEGICFDTEANLYIANEGRGLAAKIYVYPQQQ